MIRNLKYVVVLLSVASLAAVGCSKEKKEKAKEGAADKAAKSPAEAASSAAADKASAARPGKVAATKKTGFAIMPKDSNMVVGINIPKITQSSLFKTYAEPLIMAQGGAKLRQFKEVCNMDPMTAIDSVIVGGKAKDEDAMVIAIKGMTREQMSQCGEAMAKVEGDKVDITQEGAFTKVVDHTEGETMYFGWLDNKTMIGSPKGDSKDKIQSIMSGSTGMDQNKGMMDLLGNVDTKSALWMAMENTEGGGAAPIDFSAMYVSISLDGGLKVDAGIRQASADEAKKTVEMATQQLEGLKGTPFEKFGGKIQLKTNGGDVIAQISLTDADIQEIIGAAMNNPDMMNMFQMFTGGGM